MKSKKLSFFLIVIYGLAIVAFYSAFVYNNFSKFNNFYLLDFIAFILLTAFAESFIVKFNENIALSPAFAITVAAICLFGTFRAMVIVSLGVSLRVFKLNNKYIHIFNTPVYKTLYNISNLSISIFCASNIFYAINKQENILNLKVNIIGFVLLVILFLLINTLIVSVLFYILSNQSFYTIILQHLKLGILNIVAMAPFGLLLAYLYANLHILGVIILIVPIMLSRYTFTLYIEVKSKYIQTVKALMHAIEARDKYTEGHSRQVSQIAEMIAKELKYSQSKIEQLSIASFLHDVGKIGIDDSILNKPGKLTIEEYDIIKQHPVIGYEILKDIKDLDYVSVIVKHHHERYDGKGYPSGKKADELNLDVFIVQLADSIDAMATDRPYRKALSQEKIIDEVTKNRGTQFHPQVVDAYLAAMKKQKLLNSEV